MFHLVGRYFEMKTTVLAMDLFWGNKNSYKEKIKQGNGTELLRTDSTWGGKTHT